MEKVVESVPFVEADALPPPLEQSLVPDQLVRLNNSHQMLHLVGREGELQQLQTQREEQRAGNGAGH